MISSKGFERCESRFGSGLRLSLSMSAAASRGLPEREFPKRVQVALETLTFGVLDSKAVKDHLQFVGFFASQRKVVFSFFGYILLSAHITPVSNETSRSVRVLCQYDVAGRK